MAKQRKEAPAATVVRAHVDLRRKLEQEYDARDLEYKHFWADAKAVAGKNVEPVRGNDGNLIENGLSIFCRIPRAMWERRQRAACDRSLHTYKTAIGGEVQYDGKPATVYANPKRPVEFEVHSPVERDDKSISKEE